MLLVLTINFSESDLSNQNSPEQLAIDFRNHTLYGGDKKIDLVLALLPCLKIVLEHFASRKQNVFEAETEWIASEAASHHLVE